MLYNYYNYMSMEGIDKIYITDTIRTILEKTHVNHIKHKINVKQDRLTFACPICGDSSKNPHEKRGHLFFNNLYYKCYNEDCRSTFTGLCKTFGITVDIDLHERIRNYIDIQLSLYNKKNDEWFMSNFDKLIPMEEFMDWANSGNSPYKELGEINFGSKAYMYLLDRGFNEKQITTYFYQATKVVPWGLEPYIIFLNVKNDKVLGMQERNLRLGDSRRFKIWTFKEIYDNVYKTDLDMIESIGYNKLSYLFNIFNVDFNGIVTIFEGYIDSLFFPNSIGAVGANTDFRIFKDNDIETRFFFDNDVTGKDNSYKYLKEGYSVFLWEKLIKYLASKEIDPYQYTKWFNNNIKDMNQLILKTKLTWKDLLPFFSDNKMDIIYLNYVKQNWYQKKKEEEKNKNNIHNYEWKL